MPGPVAVAGPGPGITGRRVVAHLLDLVLLAVVAIPLFLGILALGFATAGAGFGLALAFFPLLFLLYYGFSLAMTGRTPGMGIMGLELRFMDGQPVRGLIALAHVLLFYLSTGALTPFVLLIGLFRRDGRLLHDLLLDTIVTDTLRP